MDNKISKQPSPAPVKLSMAELLANASGQGALPAGVTAQSILPALGQIIDKHLTFYKEGAVSRERVQKSFDKLNAQMTEKSLPKVCLCYISDEISVTETWP